MTTQRTARTIETWLAVGTLVLLVPYVPLETWVSWRYGLLNPHYIIDVIAMALMFAGGLHSLAARPRPAPGLLAIAIAWASANGWRATFDRVQLLRDGGALDHGSPELWIIAIVTGLGLCALALAIWLVVRADAANTPAA